MNKCKKLFSLILSIAMIAGLFACGHVALESFRTIYLDCFDTVSYVIAYGETQEKVDGIADVAHDELIRLHKLFDIYNHYDGINNLYDVNAVAGDCVLLEVDNDIAELVEMSKDVNIKSNGAVNIALGSVLKLWHNARNFGIANPERAKLPDMSELKAAAEHTNIDNIVLTKDVDSGRTLIGISDEKTSIDVGATAKGYATEAAAKALIDKGVKNALLNVGGNVRTIGTKLDGSSWKIGIQDPFNEEGIAATVALDDMALSTSGVYQRYYEVDGVRYHHIIDETTLMPSTRYASVSVIANDAGLADALSTALFNLSIEDGKELLTKYANASAMWIDSDGNKTYTELFKRFITEE